MNLQLILPDPILSALRSRRLSEVIKCSKPSDTHALQFCLTACSTIVDTAQEFDYNTKIEFYSDFMAEDLAGFSLRDLEMLDMSINTFPFIWMAGGIPDGHDPGSPTVFLLQMAYRALPVICFELISYIKQGKAKNTHLRANTPTSAPASFPLPPMPLTIPFPSFMDIPLPFSLGCADMLATCHLRTMTTAAFIESGEWTGYFGAQLQRPLHDMSRPRFDPPTERVKFSVVPKDGELGVLVLRSSALSDHGGKFYLEGELWIASGKINLRRRHEKFPSVVYFRALITPFGIFANWAVAEGHWMWLWKSEWSAGLVEW